jgi:hypothetical protein
MGYIRESISGSDNFSLWIHGLEFSLKTKD